MNALVLSAVLAATPITLDQVRQESRNNLQALLSELDRVRASEQTRVAIAPLLPQLQVTSTANRTWAQAGDPRLINNQLFPSAASASNWFTLQATVSQLLFDLSRFAGLASAGESERAARGAVAEQLLASEFEGVRRFYALWTAQKQLLVLQATAERSKEFADRAQAVFEAGRGNKGDALAAAVNLGTDRINVEKQRAVVSQAQIDLASWIARPEGTELEAVDPVLPESPPRAGVTLAQALELARTNRPILVQYGALVRAARANETVQAAGWAPRLYLQGGYGRQSDDASKVFGSWDKYGAASVGLNLTWDLFNGFQTDAQTKQARAQLAQARLNLAQNERDVEGQVKVALDSLEAQLKALEVAQQNRVTATQNLDYAQERFRAGASSTLEVRDAQVKLAQAYQTLIQSRSDAEVARAAVQKAMGTLGNGATP